LIDNFLRGSIIVFALAVSGGSAVAQESQDQRNTDSNAGDIDVSNPLADEEIKNRIQGIYSEIDTLASINVSVSEGVVFLSGSVANETQASRALGLAERLEGVVTVDDDIQRNLDIQGNVAPLVEQLSNDLARWAQATPLIILACGVFFVIAYAGHLLARWSTLWRWIMPNPFLGELLAQAVRVIAIVAGLIAALNLLDASAMIGTVLGGAGVVGLAIGFAVRDSLDNYISSIMLSLRQPFRANDHVVIGEHEGKVIRLTSRATILMTLNGNHLRIPNSAVFKAVILNYTRNPERRFEFELGIDAEDDPIAAMKIGMDELSRLPFVVNDPGPNALISAVGDSNIVISFMAWIDQRYSDFGKSRSLAIPAVKTVLEDRGFTLPEPIYRLRVDQFRPVAGPGVDDNKTPFSGDGADSANPRQNPAVRKRSGEEATIDVSPDDHLEEQIEKDRALNPADDLLDDDRPAE